MLCRRLPDGSAGVPAGTYSEEAPDALRSVIGGRQNIGKIILGFEKEKSSDDSSPQPLIGAAVLLLSLSLCTVLPMVLEQRRRVLQYPAQMCVHVG
jgi:hypothetical protein